MSGAGGDPSFAFAGARVAAGGLVLGIIATVAAQVALIVGLKAFDMGAPSALVTVVGLGTLWVFMVGACRRASLRYGTGRIARDLGLNWRWMDLLRGVGATLAGRVVTTIVAVPLVAYGLSSSNTRVISDQKGSAWALVAVGAAAVVGAPIVEELFFRGLVLRSLASRLGWWRAVSLQALLFGLAHANPAGGWRTLSVSALTATFGLCQGVFARRWSLGPLIVSHALFNLLPVLTIAFS